MTNLLAGGKNLGTTHLTNGCFRLHPVEWNVGESAGTLAAFALETGQEPARTLLHFFKDAGRGNLRINFDPANMILYGTGDPIEALGVLAAHVISVHCKDGDWPPKGVPGALGTERPLGQGAVGMERFIAKLKEIGYRNPLNIEREGVPDHQQKLADIKMGVGLLQNLLVR